MTLLGVFFVGFASDFLVVRFYQSVSQRRFLAAITSNSLLMIANVVFVGVAVGRDLWLIAVYVLGQNAGILIAMWFGNEKKYVEKN
ncbi:MAG: hypothetical protein PHC68_17525 [Syntrophorhabdaceae bacterium]|nr:hypothetical protein [Syntrophorhabdaceae bacterium]